MDAPLVHPASASDENSEVAAIDQRMNWLVDFAAAEAIGMALRLPVSGPVDLLLVSGVRGEAPDAGAQGFAALLDSQRFTAGLGFVEPATLTSPAATGVRILYTSLSPPRYPARTNWQKSSSRTLSKSTRKSTCR
jgi:hypothetical protein